MEFAQTYDPKTDRFRLCDPQRLREFESAWGALLAAVSGNTDKIKDAPEELLVAAKIADERLSRSMRD